MRFGIVFSGGKVHGPTPVDERGFGGSTEDKIPFIVVPGPRSPYFPTVDFDIDGAQGFKDRELGFWSIVADSRERANEIVGFLQNGGLQ